VISKLDIWRAADLLISQHGEGAVMEATRRAGRMLDCERKRRGSDWRLRHSALRRGKPN
jgi:hypothetical protein